MKKPTVIWRPARGGNYRFGRVNPISRITFHHIVGDAPAALDRFQNSEDEVSSTYVIGSDGTIYQCIYDTDTPYSDGSYDSNTRTISIEHAGGASYIAYTDAMYEASTQLVAWLISAYGINEFYRHRDVIDKTAYPGGTACPGTLDVERIVNAAKKMQGENIVTTQDATAILDSFYWTFAGRKVKISELAEYVPYFVAGTPDKFFKKASQFDEIKKFIGTSGAVNHDTALDYINKNLK